MARLPQYSRRKRRTGGIPDPSWKSGPPEPSHRHDEHDMPLEPHGPDFDGFGTDEVSMVEGEPLVVIQQSFTCRREGCDATRTERLLFTDHTLAEDEKAALDAVSGPDEPAAYVWDHCEQVGPESIEIALGEHGVGLPDTITVTMEERVVDEAYGPCHGRTEPDPDVHAHMYDEL